MPALINMPRAAWKRPPCQKVRINIGSGHTYLPHLVSAFVFNPGNGFIDLVTGQSAVPSGNLSYFADSYGIGIGGFSSANFLTLPYITHSTVMTIVLVQRNLSTANTGGHKFGSGADVSHSPWSNSDFYYVFGTARSAVTLLNSEATNPRTCVYQSKGVSDNSGAAWLRSRNGYRSFAANIRATSWSGSPIIGKWNDSWPFNGVVYACLIFRTAKNENFVNFPGVPAEVEEILKQWWLFFLDDYQKTFFIPSTVAALPILSSPTAINITATTARPQVVLTY